MIALHLETKHKLLIAGSFRSLSSVIQLKFIQRKCRLTCFSLFLSLISSLRKGSTGDGPREGELEDLHEDEPSSWVSRQQSFVLNSILFTSLCLKHWALTPPSTHFLQISDTLQTSHSVHWGNSQGFKSDTLLVLTFRLVLSGLLSFLLLFYPFLPHLAPNFHFHCSVSGH